MRLCRRIKDYRFAFMKNTVVCLFILSGVISAFAFAELYLYLTGYTYKPHTFIFQSKEFYQDGDYTNFFTLDPWEIFRPRPNATIVPRYWQTDAYGFRYNPAHNQYSHAAKTILVIGDSYAYGHGVSDTEAWPVKLESSFRENGGDVYIYNAAVPATGTDMQYVRLHKLVNTLKPTSVVWSISFNDMKESNLACLFKKQPDNSYRYIPGFLNIAYINAFMEKLLPKWFIRTRVGNLVTTLSVSGNDLATFGCTQNIPDTALQPIYFDKLTYLLSQTKRRLDAQKISFYVVLAPAQLYFDPSYDNNSYFIQFLHQFTQAFELAHVRYIDLNGALALNVARDIYAYRTGSSGQLTSIDSSRALGASAPQESNMSDIPHRLFLDEGSSSYGGWHLNSEGNDMIAKLLMQSGQIY